jgi:endonuclease/exonuclease/phosphatase family metal-dependent hydrolase
MLTVLSWNLFHGRAVPDVPHAVADRFARTLAGWEWDVALLQECPPWWPEPLARACGAHAYRALTSRNQLLCALRPLAERRPDIVKSWGGGCNAILVRGAPATAHARRRLRLRPERRVLHAVQLASGVWVGNVHAQAHRLEWAQADLDLCSATLLRWADHGPAVLGGDLNLKRPVVPGFTSAGGHVLDHLFVHDVEVVQRARTLERGGLSDHVPVMARLRTGTTL